MSFGSCTVTEEISYVCSRRFGTPWNCSPKSPTPILFRLSRDISSLGSVHFEEKTAWRMKGPSTKGSDSILVLGQFWLRNVMSLVPPNNYQHKYKETHSSRHRFNVSADQGIGQNSSHLVDFVTDTNEHKRCQDNVEQWLIRNQNQNAFGVMRQPNVILRYKQLKEKNTISLNVYPLRTQMFHTFYLEIWLYVPRKLKHKRQPF